MFVKQIQAQSKDLHIGVQTGMGLTLSNLYDGGLTYSSKLTITKDLSKLWFGELGLSYNRYAYTYNISGYDDYPNNKHTINDNYMGISAIAGVQFFKKVKLVIKVGPELSYLVKSRFHDENLNSGNTTVKGFSSDYKYRFGIVAGAGVIVPISNKLRLTVDVMTNSSIPRVRESGLQVSRPNSIKISAGVQMKF